ncbi:MAG TPA: universal stress protein [Steroidobacteraceae bacterium]|nr:universal stress protein [Steroidobacteraceae bacterium]
MTALKKLLVIVDPTIEDSAAVRKAARLARAASAAVELHICDFAPELDAARFLDAPTLSVAVAPVAARHQVHLDRLASALRADGIAVTTSVEFANPLHEGILRRVAALGPDLVVKDSHYHGALKRALLSHADWHLIRDCPVPLLLTKQLAWHEPARVAAAVDPNHPGDVGASIDHALIDEAEALARVLGTRPWVLHVFSTLNLISVEPGVAALPLGTDLAAVEVLRTLHRTQLEGLAARHGIAASETRLIDGIVTYALPDFAADGGLDVLAIGAIARSRLHDRFIGSTADRVLDRIACDLLIVKPPAPRAA